MPFVTSKNPQIPVPPTPSFRKVHELSLKSGSLMATPPQGPKNDAGETLSSHYRLLLRLAKVTQKRGFSRRFPGGFPTVLPVVSRRFSSGSTPVFQRFFQRFDARFPAVSGRSSGSFASGLPAVFQRFCRRFSNDFPAVLPVASGSFPTVLPPVFQRFAGNTLPLDQPPAGSGIPD